VLSVWVGDNPLNVEPSAYAAWQLAAEKPMPLAAK